MDIKQEYREKVNLCWNHIESQSKYLRELLDGMEKGAGINPEADYARAVETVGNELKQYATDLQTLSRQYQDYLKADKRKDDEEKEMQKTLAKLQTQDEKEVQN